MADLKTKYMGIELKNPIIIGANNLTSELDKAKKMEDSGAAAIVYRSLFEEQVQLDNLHLFEDGFDGRLELKDGKSYPSTDKFLNELRKTKEALSIPIFGSLNAIHFESWIEFAKKIEQTGVDGLEINLYYVPNDFELMGRAIIQEKLDIVEAVIKTVNIPVAIKLSPFYTNPLYVIKEMDKLGADAFVLFNKLFQPEVDIKSEKMIFPDNLSCPDEHNLPLRYTGLVYGNINADICASRGIFSAENAIAMILAGANTVQTVSSIYKHGCVKIEEIVKGLEHWMDQKGYTTIDDFRGKLSRKNIKDPMVYRRAQYVDILLHG